MQVLRQQARLGAHTCTNSAGPSRLPLPFRQAQRALQVAQSVPPGSEGVRLQPSYSRATARAQFRTLPTFPERARPSLRIPCPQRQWTAFQTR